MPAATQTSKPSNTTTPVSTANDAIALARHFGGTLDMLIDLMRQETELIRAGRVGSAVQLAPQKAKLSGLYVADVLRLRASKQVFAQVAPREIETLRQRHDEFRALLQTNLTVLATAHAVSEGIVRGVSGELARKAAPQTYGASGRANMPSPRTSQPLAVSRSM